MNETDSLDRLIKAGWQVVESDFNEEAFRRWRQQARECLAQLLGNDHVYTKHFDECVNAPAELPALAGKGILIAAREEVVRGNGNSRRTHPSPESNEPVSPASTRSEFPASFCKRYGSRNRMTSVRIQQSDFDTVGASVSSDKRAGPTNGGTRKDRGRHFAENVGKEDDTANL